MATIAPTVADGEARTVIVTWANLGPGDDGTPVRYAGAADRTVQVVGTFGGATVSIQGTLENVAANWATLNDAQGNAIAITESKIEAVTELVRQLRPVVVGGSGTDVTVMLLMRQTI